MNRVFSFMPDGLLKPVRTIIDNLLWTKYGSGDVLVVLSILYPWADLKNNSFTNFEEFLVEREKLIVKA